MNVYKLQSATYHTLNHEAGLRQALLMEIARLVNHKEDDNLSELRDIVARMIKADRGNRRYIDRYKTESQEDDENYRTLLHRLAA